MLRREAAIGVFDSILGLGSSQNTQQGVQNGIAALMGGVQSGNSALKGYTGQANDALTSNTNLGLASVDKGYGSAIGALGAAGTQAQGLLAKGTQDGVDTTLGGNASYTPYLASGGNASSMLSKALGLAGPAGTAEAQAAFHASPGYGFSVDQATDAASRKAASLGLAGSGSTLDAITRLGSNLANQEYGNWLTNLSGLGTQGLAAASDVSANDRTAGGLQASGGQTGAQLAANLGGQIGTAYAGQGTADANLYNTLGQGLSNNLTGLGQGISSNDMNEAARVAGLQVQGGQAEDNMTSANNGVLSKLIGGITGLPLGGSSLSTPSLGGFSVTPSTSGSGGFTVAPTSGSTSSGTSGGIFGPLFSKFGTGLSKAVAY